MDNDLMARRLRPPSEPPRPQNGHSPVPMDTPPWAMTAEAHDEVPWDRPQDEPWPPTGTDDQQVAAQQAAAQPAVQEQQFADVWPPRPAQTYEVAATSDHAQPEKPPVAADDVREESPWAEQTAWPEQPAWQDQTAAPDEPAAAHQPGSSDASTGTDQSSWTQQYASAQAAPWKELPAAPAEAATPQTPWQPQAQWRDEPVMQQNPWQAAHAEHAEHAETQPVEPQPVERQAAEPQRTDIHYAQEQPWEEQPVAQSPQQPIEINGNGFAPWQPIEINGNGIAPHSYDETTAPADAVLASASKVHETPTDVSVAGRAPWDRPAPFSWDAPQDFDDRPADMLAAFDEMVPDDDMVPVVSRFVAAAKTQPTPVEPAPVEPAPVAPAPVDERAQDPYDAQAPVLNDVRQPAGPSWPAWSSGSEVDGNRSPVQPEFRGRALGPTPPDDLFGRPAATVAPIVARPEPAAEPVFVPQPEPMPEPQHAPEQLPAVFSTAPAMAQQPLVLRIELAIVDDSNKLRPVDAARRVGPTLDEETDSETLTPRHPDFEPRNRVAPPATDEADLFATTEQEPAPPVPDDLPWALPQLGPLEPLEPRAAVAAQQPSVSGPAPWSRPVQPVQQAQPLEQPQPVQQTQPVQPAQTVQPAPTFTQPEPMPPVHIEPAAPAWADPNPTAAWTLQQTVADPLSTLPAATFAAPAQAAYMQPPYTAPAVYLPEPEPAFQPATALGAVGAQPTAAPVIAPLEARSPAPDVTSAPARPAANAKQSDLWFLASEPDIAAAEEADATEKTGPSTLVTAGLTVLMAVVVIALVLIFIQLMTSLLG